MSTQQKRGFRLPWAADRSAEDGAGATTLEAGSGEPATLEQTEDGVGGELGEGPFHFADVATPDASTDASPEAPEVPETTAEAAMSNTESVTSETEEQAASGAAEAWPAFDRRPEEMPEASAQTAPDGHADGRPDAADADPAPMQPARVTRAAASREPDGRARSNPLVAGLVKAMREAAVASRDETTTRLQTEATARTEAIREAGTSQAASLRKQADDDIAGIREWSKSEIARIKQETDERIEQRKSELTSQIEHHEASVGRLADQVQATVSAFEADMDRFFERLLAENDPARLAALAEQAPEPPDLSAELVAVSYEAEAADQAEAVGESDAANEADATAAGAWEGVDWGSPVPPEMTDPAAALEPDAAALEPDAAAEAEAASTEGLDLHSDGVWPTSVLAAARRSAHPAGTEFEAAGVANSRLFVNGLTSVAGISAFKGALGQLSGVRSVSVSSGEPGVFIFTVVHTPETDLQDGVSGLTTFSARVTEAAGDSLTVVAQEPAA